MIIIQQNRGVILGLRFYKDGLDVFDDGRVFGNNDDAVSELALDQLDLLNLFLRQFVCVQPEGLDRHIANATGDPGRDHIEVIFASDDQNFLVGLEI